MFREDPGSGMGADAADELGPNWREVLTYTAEISVGCAVDCAIAFGVLSMMLPRSAWRDAFWWSQRHASVLLIGCASVLVWNGVALTLRARRALLAKRGKLEPGG